MKKHIYTSIFLMSLLTSVAAQTIRDHKVNFNYIQLPNQPLDENIKSYSVHLVKNYEEANEDSIESFNNRLELAKEEQEAQIETWNNERKRIDKLYYAEMAVWQKSVNEGVTTIAKPNDPVYLEYPYLKDIPLPILTEEIEESYISNKINLNGYEKDEGGAIITCTVSGLQNARIDEKITGSAASTRYKYTAYYKMPIHVKLEVPEKGVIYEKTFYGNEQTKILKTEKSEYDFKIWWLDNGENFWKNTQIQLLNSAMSSFNSYINENYGYPHKSSQAEIFVIKKYKSFNYDKYVDALTYVKNGYTSLSSDVNKTVGKEKINKGIEIWEAELEESNVNDNKSRINKKATALLYANLAEAYLWIDNFEKSDLYANKGVTLGVLKYKNHCKRVQDKIGALKSRYEANQ